MSDEEILAVLERLNKSEVLCADGKKLRVSRDFDSEETRVWISGEPKVRVDEDRLCDFLNELGGSVTEGQMAALLCDIYGNQQKHSHLIVKGGLA